MKAAQLQALERLCCPLYPTWFRWKEKKTNEISDRETNFISHMVQMKGSAKTTLRASATSLYPTWFRWKYGETDTAYLARLPLYPTWFRWKSTPGCSLKRADILYIPHGSDESVISNSPFTYNSQLYIPHGSDERVIDRADGKIKLLALYPTWFRWKYSFDIFHSILLLSFISHMVQMKEQEFTKTMKR